MTRQGQANLCAALTVVLWGTAATAFKIALRGLDVLQLLCCSAWVSTLALLAVLAAQRKLHLVRRMGRRDWARSVLLGTLNPIAYYLVLFKAYSLLPAQEALPLNFLWPIALVALSAAVLGQRLHLRDVIAMAVCFAGVVVISTRGDLAGLRFGQPLGVALAVGSSAIWATYWVLNVRDERSDVLKLFTAFLCSLAPLSIAAVAFSRPTIGGEQAAAALAAAVWVGLFEMGLTYVVWLRALRLATSTARVARFTYLIPFASLLCIAVVLREPIRWSSIVGLVLIVAGIVLSRRSRLEPQSP
jgi:drug/metabolite transporter (DMT)-like permease